MDEIKDYKNKKENFIVFAIVLNVIYLGMALFLYVNNLYSDFRVVIAVVLGYIFLLFVLFIWRENLIISWKYKILKPEIEKLGLEYEPDLFVDENLIKESYLFKEYENIEGQDLVRGDNFVFSYICLTKDEYYTITNSKGETETEVRTVTIFDGIFFAGLFPKEIEGYYLVKKNSLHLSDILPIFVDKERIKLDMPEFEKVFDVYGTDQIEGRYIFDFTFMKNLLEVYEILEFEKFAINGNVYFFAFPLLKFDVSVIKDVKKCIEYNLNLVYVLSNIDKILFKGKK